MEIIIKPILTEKMTIQGEKLNRYGFIVDVRANKPVSYTHLNTREG